MMDCLQHRFKLYAHQAPDRSCLIGARVFQIPAQGSQALVQLGARAFQQGPFVCVLPALKLKSTGAHGKRQIQRFEDAGKLQAVQRLRLGGGPVELRAVRRIFVAVICLDGIVHQQGEGVVLPE